MAGKTRSNKTWIQKRKKKKIETCVLTELNMQFKRI